MPKDENTEEKILDAAQAVFQEKGYSGARMQEIADEARINKGLLHYYFKSKDRLFDKVLDLAFGKVARTMGNSLNSELPLDEKIRLFVHSYITIASHNSFMIRFVINELHRNPEKFVGKMLARQDRPDFEAFSQQVEDEIAAGRIRPIDPHQLFINMLAMCVFPFLARPMIQGILSKDNPAFKEMIEDRKTAVADFILHSLRP
jgi:AcrR family transcriptional regulator